MKVDQAKPKADGLLWKQIFEVPDSLSLRWALQRHDLAGWAPTVAGFGLACMACCADGLIGWRDPGSLPICEDREIRLAMSDYSRAESDGVIWLRCSSRLTHWERGTEERGRQGLSCWCCERGKKDADCRAVFKEEIIKAYVPRGAKKMQKMKKRGRLHISKSWSVVTVSQNA